MHAAARVLCALVAASVLPAVCVRSEPSYAAGKTVHWHLTLNLKCVDRPANESACELLEGAHYPIMGILGTVFTDQATADLVSDVHGSFSGSLTGTYAEQATRLKPACSQTALSLTSFNGTCQYQTRLWGRIRRLPSGRPEFFSSTLVQTFYGQHNQVVHRPGERDTGFPAEAGSWSATKMLRRQGVKKVTARMLQGISYTLVVTRH